MNRRNFMTLTSAGIGLTILPKLSLAMDSSSQGSLSENLKVTVVEKTDVIVCGAGPAGVSAAISAARAGAKVTLIEANGCLGGVWTSGLLTWIFDFDKPGFTKELSTSLEKRDARVGTSKQQFVYDPEQMKILLEDLCTESNIRIRLHTRVVAAYKTGKRLTSVVTESRSGREAWQASVFIDATGDGCLGVLAGCSWDYGNNTNEAQPLTMNALAVIKDITKIGHYVSFYEGGPLHEPARFMGELKRANVDPSYGHPTLFHIRDNVVLVMVNHEYGIDPFNADQMTSATIRSRKEVGQIISKVNNLGGIWEGFKMVASAEQIGIREGRRLHGLYTITEDDLRKGSKQPDAVARVTFGVDIHAHNKDKNDKETISHGGFRTIPYDIPLRSLIAKDVEGLMMAGRCISGDFMAHASYRVTGNSVAMGEAAGKVAAQSARSGTLPHKIGYSEIFK